MLDSSLWRTRASVPGSCLRTPSKGSTPSQRARLASKEARLREERTIRTLVDLWLVSRESKAWRPRTRAEFGRTMRKSVLPVIGDRDPNSVTRGEVRKLLDDIAEGRGFSGEGPNARKRTRPTPIEANRVYATLHLFFEWLHKERQEWLGVTAHPLTGLEKPSPERIRTRTYSNQEIRALLACAPGTELEDFLPLLFHTATRSEETRSMKWADVDFERALWTIPPEAAKTGEIRGESHAVPLSTGGLERLQRRQRQKVAPLSPYVFPAPCGGFMRHPSRGIAIVRRRSGVADFRLHDVRRTVSQRTADEFGEGMSHSILGHARQRLGRTYIPNRPLKEQREALEWWSAELARIREKKGDFGVRLGGTASGGG